MRAYKAKPKPFYARECRHCAKPFQTRHEDKVYCGASCAAMHQKSLRTNTCKQCEVAHPSVTTAKPVCVACLFFGQVRTERQELSSIIEWLGDRGLCFYCGDYATDDEHVVPRRTHLPTWVVRACRECNSLAGGELFSSVLDKQRFIQERREQRYQKLLKAPEWSKDELSEMGRNMRLSIETSERVRKCIQAQLKWDPLKVADLPDLA